MAKRKQGNPQQTSSRKRLKHRHGDIDLDRDYKVKSILRETKTHYLISWEDDEQTGEKYEDTWEPKKNANKLAVDDWEAQKASRAQAEPVRAAPQDTSSGTRPSSSPPRKAVQSRRSRRVIDSSPPPEGSKASNGIHDDFSGGPVLEIGESQPEQSTSESPEAQSPKRLITPAVHPGSPPSSYFAGEYQQFSSSAVATPVQVTQFPAFIASTKVVPDSQTQVNTLPSLQALNPASINLQIQTAVSHQIGELPSTVTETNTDVHAPAEASLIPKIQATSSSRILDCAIDSTATGTDKQEKSSKPECSSEPLSLRPEQGPAAATIDLTTTQQQSSLSKFTVTPPLRAIRTYQDRVLDRAIGSEAWQSSFPQQTQRFERVTDSEHRTPNSSRPVEEPIPQFTSSPITPVPSHSIAPKGIGDSAPPPPPSVSSRGSARGSAHGGDIMDSSRRSTPSNFAEMREHLRAVRAQSKLDLGNQDSKSSSAAGADALGSVTSVPNAAVAKRALASPFLFARDDARSPSAVPADEPLPVITLEEMTTSARYETLLPQSQGGAGESNANGDTAPSKSRNDPAPEAPAAYAVPIYLVGHQRDLYPQTVYFYKTVLQRFLTSKSPDEALVGEVRHFVDRIRRITVHPDLGNAETYTQYDVQPFQQAIWDVSCSAKFRFLKDLFEHLQDSKLRIAILASQVRIMDILETFMQGIRVAYERPIANSPSNGQSSSNSPVAILLEANAETEISPAVDAVIVLDNSVSCDSKQVRDLRRDGRITYITMVVPRSIEHVERCLSANLPALAHLRALVSGIYQYRDGAGRSQGADIESNAFALAEFLKSNGEKSWEISPLDELEDFDSQTESELDPGLENSATNLTGEKRSRTSEEPELGDLSTKRSRVESPVAPQPHEGDTTHISDSLENLTQPGSSHDVPHPALTATESRLQNMLGERQDRLDELAKAMGDLQFRFEEQRTSLLEVTKERDQAIITAQAAIGRLSEESNKMSSVRAENSRLKEELQQANARLLDHSIPERAHFEAQRIASEQANVERGKAEKRLESANKDLAYIRELYQSASKAAQSSTAQVTELEGQLAAAEARATGEQAKLRQMGMDEFTKKLRNDVHKLRAMVSDREAALKFRDEEIAKMKEASRGRMGTRGTSLPRSPRLGSPRPGSRQTSPATAEPKARPSGLHPLREMER